MVAVLFGFALETYGYGGRIGQSLNPFDSNTFMLLVLRSFTLRLPYPDHSHSYLVTITIAPAFICCGIYLTLARIVVVYEGINPSKRVARFRPRVYAIPFVCFDIICLLIQIIGGLLAVSNTIDTSGYTNGVNLMIGGIAVQVASLVLFSACALDVVWRIYKTPADHFNAHFADLRQTHMFQGFLWALATAVVTIVIRSTYRIAELSGGFNGPLFNEQVTFMILEGMMMSICATALTIFHPGIAFDRRWHEATWSLRGRKVGISVASNSEKPVAEA